LDAVFPEFQGLDLADFSPATATGSSGFSPERTGRRLVIRLGLKYSLTLATRNVITPRIARP